MLLQVLSSGGLDTSVHEGFHSVVAWLLWTAGAFRSKSLIQVWPSSVASWRLRRVLLLLIQSGDRDIGDRVLLLLIQSGDRDMGHRMGHLSSYNPLDLIKIHKTWEQEGQTFHAEDLANEDK